MDDFGLPPRLREFHPRRVRHVHIVGVVQADAGFQDQGWYAADHTSELQECDPGAVRTLRSSRAYPAGAALDPQALGVGVFAGQQGREVACAGCTAHAGRPLKIVLPRDDRARRPDSSEAIRSYRHRQAPPWLPYLEDGLSREKTASRRSQVRASWADEYRLGVRGAPIEGLAMGRA